MEFDRDRIVRKDFKRAVRGYDMWEVDSHLRETFRQLNILFEQIARGQGDLPEPVRERVQAHVTLAQLAAAEILDGAEAEGRRTAEALLETAREEAAAYATQRREEAERAAAEYARELRADAERQRERMIEAAQAEAEQRGEAIEREARRRADATVREAATRAHAASTKAWDQVAESLFDAR